MNAVSQIRVKKDDEDPSGGHSMGESMSDFEIKDIFHFVGRCVKAVWEWSQEPLNQIILIVGTTVVFGSVFVVVFFHCVRNCQKWCHSRSSPSHHRRTCHCSSHPPAGSASLLPQTQLDGVSADTQQPMLDNGLDHTPCAPELGEDDVRHEQPVDPSAPPVEEIVEVPEGPLPSSPPPPPYDELLELEDLTGSIKPWEEENDSDELPPYEHFGHINSRDGFVRISQV